MRIFARYLLLSAVAAIFAMPLFGALATSLSPLEQAYSVEGNFWPSETRWENYTQAIQKLPVLTFTFNSFVISIAGVLGTLLSTSMAGYAFAVMRWRGRSCLFVVLLAMLVVPTQIYLIPHFLLFKQCRRNTTHLGGRKAPFFAP